MAIVREWARKQPFFILTKPRKTAQYEVQAFRAHYNSCGLVVKRKGHLPKFTSGLAGFVYCLMGPAPFIPLSLCFHPPALPLMATVVLVTLSTGWRDRFGGKRSPGAARGRSITKELAQELARHSARSVVAGGRWLEARPGCFFLGS